MRTVEHAGRIVKVRIVQAVKSLDDRIWTGDSASFRKKLLVEISMDSPSGKVSVSLPFDKALELSETIKLVMDEHLVNGVMKA